MIVKAKYIGLETDWLYENYWLMDIHPDFFIKLVITKNGGGEDG